MLIGYFDESGGEADGFTTVCGYVATEQMWEHFEADWKLHLIKYDVPYSHMREFAHGIGPFKKWKEKWFETTRQNFLRGAAEIIHSRVSRAFICTVMHKDFRAARERYPSRLYPQSEYALAGRTCVALANEWLLNSQPTLDLKYVFDDGGPDKGGLINSTTTIRPYHTVKERFNYRLRTG